MNIIQSILSSSVFAAGLALASGPAHAAPACGQVSLVERRIVERADGDIESLRSLVRVTAFVYGVNMLDVRDNLDHWRAAVECRKQVAATERAEPAADQSAADEAPVRMSQR